MKYPLALLVALAVSLAIIPIMMRYASRFGMLDKPDPRKVHATPIPRVGGWGIVLGAIASVLVWGWFPPYMQTYLLGALILLGFGAWDDRKEQGHYSKFVGQLIAVIPVTTYGGLYITHLPFGIGPLDPAIGITFTVIAMIGMINAINHSDGLDGLAGGESLLSLAAIAILSYQAGGELGAVVAVATFGGVLGFLRYNTHPARVFMGDGGSQFLGFTLGFLAILLTQKIDKGLSPSVVALLLGLPVIDTIAVLIKRIRGGMSWFKATRTHIHHRLLDLGFVHQQAVVIIYMVHSFLVISGILLARASDWIIIGLYFGTWAALFWAIRRAEKSGWKTSTDQRHPRLWRSLLFIPQNHYTMVVLPRRFLEISVPLFLAAGAFIAADVPRDVGFLAIVMFVLLITPYIARTRTAGSLLRRALTYAVATIVVYLTTNYPPISSIWYKAGQLLFFFVVAISVFLALRFSPNRRKEEFRTTAMDYLMILVTGAALLATGLFSRYGMFEYGNATFVIYLAILLYACELLIVERREHPSGLGAVSFLAMAVLVIRGFV